MPVPGKAVFIPGYIGAQRLIPPVSRGRCELDLLFRLDLEAQLLIFRPEQEAVCLLDQ